MKIVKSTGGEWMLDEGMHLVAMACHHKKNGACGGCYARAIRVLRALAKSGVAEAVAFIESANGDVLRPQRGDEIPEDNDPWSVR